MSQDVQTNGSIEGVFSIVFTTITISSGGTDYNYTVPVRRKVNVIY